MDKVRVRASLACEIVGFELTRLNEAISRGTYPHAPAAEGRGSARFFDSDELLRLYLFARLVYFQTRQEFAGIISYEIVQEYKARPSAVITVAMTEYEYVIVPPGIDPADAIKEKNSKTYPRLEIELEPILYKIDFYIAHAKANIDRRVVELLNKEVDKNREGNR